MPGRGTQRPGLTRRACAAIPVALAACAGPPVVTVDDLPGWTEDRFADALHAPSDAEARAFLRQRCRLRPLPSLLYTGYYEITIAGARSQSGRFQTPLLRRPQDATAFGRREIMAGALSGRQLEFAWLAGSADLFFLQLQGSGRVALAEGGFLRVTSAGANGRPAVPTEQLFNGLSDLSIPALRAWIGANPQRGEARLALDPSYVFFRESPSGPIGATGRPLLALRSLAVDPALAPLGSMVWVDVPPLRRLMFAQDTGASIRGDQADVFFGSGPQAEADGGHLHARGRGWLLET